MIKDIIDILNYKSELKEVRKLVKNAKIKISKTDLDVLLIGIDGIIEKTVKKYKNKDERWITK